MIVRKAKYKKVRELVTRQVSPDIYGCDECKKVFGGDNRLEITVFYSPKMEVKLKNSSSGLTDRHQFCSWACMGKFMPKVKTDYFVSLPYLHYDYDSQTPGTTIKDFLDLINPPKKDIFGRTKKQSK